MAKVAIFCIILSDETFELLHTFWLMYDLKIEVRIRNIEFSTFPKSKLTFFNVIHFNFINLSKGDSFFFIFDFLKFN